MNTKSEDSTMLIQRRSILTGKSTVREMNVTEEQLHLWESGVVIQKAMPHLSKEDREFLISGITTDEWNTMVTGNDGPNDALDHFIERMDG
jgi:hypothetical protein